MCTHFIVLKTSSWIFVLFLAQSIHSVSNTLLFCTENEICLPNYNFASFLLRINWILNHLSLGNDCYFVFICWFSLCFVQIQIQIQTCRHLSRMRKKQSVVGKGKKMVIYSLLHWTFLHHINSILRRKFSLFVLYDIRIQVTLMTTHKF